MEIQILLNHLLHRLFLDHDKIFYFRHWKFIANFKKKFWIVENGAFTPLKQMLNLP